MRRSRLSRYKQERLIEHFVSGSTARTAAHLVNVNTKTAAYYFRRLREIIATETQNDAMLSGAFEVDESYFGGTRKGKRGRGAAGKVPVFGILNAAERFTHRSFQTRLARHYYRSFATKSNPTQSSIQTAGGAIMCWIFRNLNIIGLTIQNCLQISIITSTVSKISGTKPSAI